MTKNELLQKLRECAESVKENSTAVKSICIPDNKVWLVPGCYSGEELGAMIYFIADMLE